LLHCSPWESRPDVHESLHHAVACAPANPARSLRQAIIGGAICRFGNCIRPLGPDESYRIIHTTDHTRMTTHLHARFESPRHAGERRIAGSWSAPMGELGRGMWCGSADISACAEQHGRIEVVDARDQRVIMKRSTSGRTGMSGYRPLGAYSSGAESRSRGRTP
jgi:hypothetical protein